MASNGSSRGAGRRAPPIAVRPQPLHIARLGRAVHKARLERVAREDHALVGGEAAIARRIQVVGRNEAVVCGLIERSGRRVDPAQREVRRVIRVERHLKARRCSCRLRGPSAPAMSERPRRPGDSLQWPSGALVRLRWRLPQCAWTPASGLGVSRVCLLGVVSP